MAQAVGLAANVLAVIDLFIKVGVQCSIYCASLKSAPRDIRSLLDEADRVSATLKDVKRLLAGPNSTKIDASQNIHRGVADCRAQLTDLAAKLEEGARWKRVTWPLKEEEVAEIVQKLERCRTTISDGLQVNQTALLLDVHQEFVLSKLHTAKGATFDAHADGDNARCHPSTRVDILQRILAWGAARDSESVFWLRGMAGTGKSTISRTIAQAFADKDMLGASFFFKRGEGDRSHAAFFFTTIATQLIRRFPLMAPFVQAEIEADPAIHEKSAKDQFDKLITGPIHKLPNHSQLLEIAIVVDALDECDNLDHMRLIINLLSQAKHFASVRLKFFVTSRPDLPIQLGFKDISSKYEDLVLHQIPKPIIEHDITIFLRHKLAKIRQDYNKSVRLEQQLSADWPGTEHVNKLVEMALPLFIFAATVCRFIQDRRIGGPKEQLEKILEHQTSQRSNLDATYLPVLHQLLVGLPESEKHKAVARFKQVVGSIVILASPLSTFSLARLLKGSLDAIEDQLDSLQSVLSIPSHPSIPVRMLHLSFRDFLVDPEKAKEQEKYPFWIDERKAHEGLATRCLQLLSMDDVLKKDVCDLQLPGIRRTDIDLQTIDDCLPPEVQYACRYWVYHWKESKRLVRDGDAVDRFLTRHLLYWLEALGILGRVSEGIPMVEDLMGILDPEESSHVSAFLVDTRRILQSHRSAIDTWPLRVYYLAILFAQERSIVKQTFWSQIPAWISRPPQVDLDWDAYLQTFEGHSGPVLSVAFSHDSKMLASASWDKTVKLWNIATGTCTATLTGHRDIEPGNVLIKSRPPDSSWWIKLSGFGISKRFDPSVEQNSTVSHANSVAFVLSVAFSHNSKILASASYDSTVKLWDTTTGTCMAILTGHIGAVHSVKFSHDSKMLASASGDETAKLWDIATSTCIATLTGHSSSVLSVAFSHDSMMLASASRDKTAKLWDIATGTCMVTFTGHSSYVQSVAFSHDSKMLASASDDKMVKLWDIATSTCIAMLTGHRSIIHSAIFSHDSKMLASASGDSTVKLWDIATGTCTVTFRGHSGYVNSVAFSHDSKMLASASDDKTAKLWDIATGTCTATLTSHSGVSASDG